MQYLEIKQKCFVLEIRPLSWIRGRETILRDIPGKTGILGRYVLVALCFGISTEAVILIFVK